MKKSILSISCIATVLILLQSCHAGTTGTWKNDHIDPDIKAEINGLNKKLLQNLKADNISGVKGMMSSALLDSAGSKIDTLVNSLRGSFTTADFKTIDEYYCKNSTDKIQNILFSGNGNNNDYEIAYEAMNNEVYTALLMPKAPTSNGIMLVSYGKYNAGWKINIFFIGASRLFNKTAPDYYNLARDEYDKGDTINAVDFICLAKELARPLSNYFKYKNEDEMKDFYAKVINEANAQYKFPMTINKIKTGPQIFSISPQTITEGPKQGIYSLIRYKSTIELSDTVALKAENLLLQKVVGSIFRGADKANNCIIYQAFNQIPNGKTMVKHYGFIQSVK